MGVKHLWDILAPVQEDFNLEDVRGKRLAVDLSIWVCQSAGVQFEQKGRWFSIRNMHSKVFRLLELGIHPVFVLDGEAPEMKSQTIKLRKMYRHGIDNAAEFTSSNSIHGNQYQRDLIKMWKDFLDVMSIPWIQSPGEAEAMCAGLEQKKMVDGCITDDSDVLLFGAKTVYKDFTCDARKTDQIKCIKMSQITKQLGLTRRDLVALALLLGCDYSPNGVNGVGKEAVMKFVDSLNGTCLLDRICGWRNNKNLDEVNKSKPNMKPVHCSSCHHLGNISKHRSQGCIECKTNSSCVENADSRNCFCDYHVRKNVYDKYKVELLIREKALKDEEFPANKVVRAFLNPDLNLENQKKISRKITDFDRVKGYFKQEGKTDKEIMQDLIPVYLSMDLNKVFFDSSDKATSVPKSIVKRRIKNFQPVVQVEWHSVAGCPNFDGIDVTTENEVVFGKNFPGILEEYKHRELANKKSKPKKKKVPTATLR